MSRDSRYTKESLLVQLYSFRACVESTPVSESHGPLQEFSRDDIRIFLQQFGNDATPDHVADMLSQAQGHVLVFLHVASDLLETALDETTLSFEIESSQENMEFGALFAFVLHHLLKLSESDPKTYRKRINP